jgi:hypothetical protein
MTSIVVIWIPPSSGHSGLLQDFKYILHAIMRKKYEVLGLKSRKGENTQGKLLLEG